MDRETRILKIHECLQEHNVVGTGEIERDGQMVQREVYNIPLKYLIYNKYNGRILSKTKSLEKQYSGLDASLEDDKKIIEKCLRESNIIRNKKTILDIKRIGQKKRGIVTKDGIIIDGNRRAMLLNKLNAENPSSNYKFKTIVLDVSLEEAPQDISRLETTYQMGEDEKVGYEPIEKYLKIRQLKELQFTMDEIADFMGESIGDVNMWYSTLESMDEYLNYRNYEGMYTQLEKTEDQFQKLAKWSQNLRGGEGKGFDGYTDLDVGDLEQISFAYIRARYEGKEFRWLADGAKGNNFFSYKDLWKDFVYEFENIIEPVYLEIDNQNPIDYDSEDLTSNLSSRDNAFIDAINGKDSLLEELTEKFKNLLENKKDKNAPSKLADKSLHAVEEIDHKSDIVQTESVQQTLQKIIRTAKRNIIKPEALLNDMSDTVSRISIDDISEDLRSLFKEKLSLISNLINDLKDSISNRN